MDEWTGGQVDERMDGWVDGLMRIWTRAVGE